MKNLIVKIRFMFWVLMGRGIIYRAEIKAKKGDVYIDPLLGNRLSVADTKIRNAR